MFPDEPSQLPESDGQTLRQEPLELSRPSMDPSLAIVACLTALATGVAYLVVVYRRPELGMLAGVFLLPLGPLASLPITSGGLRLTWLVLFSVLAIFTVRTLARQQHRVILESLLGRWSSVSVLLFSILGFLSILANGTGPGDAVWYDLYRLGVGLAVYFLICFLARDRKGVHAILGCLAAVSFLVASSGILEIVTKKRFYELTPYGGFHGHLADKLASQTDYTMRTSGLAADAPYHNLDVVTFIGVLLLLLITDRRRGVTAYCVVVLAMLMVNLAGSGSRGAAGMFALMMLVFAELVRIRHRWLIAGLVVTLVVGVAVTLYLAVPNSINLERFVRTGGHSIEVRIFNIEPAVRMFLSHPVLGIGPSRFVEFYPLYAPPEAPKVEILRPHNTYLELLAERGILGFLAYVGMMLTAMGNFLRLQRHSSDFMLRTLGGVGFSWFCGYQIFSATSNCTLRYTTWIMIGISSAAAYADSKLRAEVR